MLIQARDGYNNAKVYGGDYWVARVRSFNAKPEARIYIAAKRVEDFGNGTYLAVFPNTAYAQDERLSIQIVLIRSSTECLLKVRCLSQVFKQLLTCQHSEQARKSIAGP